MEENTRQKKNTANKVRAKPQTKVRVGVYAHVSGTHLYVCGFILESIHHSQKWSLPPSYLSARAAFPTVREGFGVKWERGGGGVFIEVKEKHNQWNISQKTFQYQHEGTETCHYSGWQSPHQSRILTTAESVPWKYITVSSLVCLILSHTHSQQKGRVSRQPNREGANRNPNRLTARQTRKIKQQNAGASIKFICARNLSSQKQTEYYF